MRDGYFQQKAVFHSRSGLMKLIIGSICLSMVLILFIFLFSIGVFAGNAGTYVIELDKYESEVLSGQIVSVQATLVPENKLVDIYFTSSNEEVLTVDNRGVAQTLKGGVAAVEAKADIGGQTITATCTVVVSSSEADAAAGEFTKYAEFPVGPDCPVIPAAAFDDEGFLSSDNLTQYKMYNADTVAWLYVPGTNINLPVAQSSLTDPEFYLSRGLNKYLKYSGSAFFDAKSSIKTAGKVTDQQTVVYGHARGTDIFDQLEHKTILQSWYNNKNNRYIYLNTTLEKTVWEVFACYYTDISDNTIATDIAKMNYLYTMDEMVEKFGFDKVAAASVQGSLPDLMKNTEKSMQVASSWRDRVLTNNRRYASFTWLAERTYDDVQIVDGDKILTLVSCADENSGVRYIVQAKLIKQKTSA